MEDPNINVLTGNSFGKDNSQNRLHMESLFTIDEEALKNAFTFDTSALDMNLADYMNMSGDSMDLSNLVDPDSISLELPDLPELDMEELMDSWIFLSLQMESSSSPHLFWPVMAIT